MKHFYFKKLTILWSVAVAASFAGCQKEPVPTETTVPGVAKVAPDGFTYATSKTIKIELRLLTNANQPVAGVPVNFFDPKAASSNASLLKSVSDKNGTVTGTLTIPGYLDTLLVKTNYIGLPLDVKVKLVNNTLTATIGGSSGVSGNVVSASGSNENFEKINLSNSFSASSINFSYPAGIAYSALFQTTGGYSQSDGRPSYISSRDVISAGLMDDMNASLPESQNVGATHPDYLSSAAVNTLKMLKNSDVWVTFVHEGAGYKNSLAYYIYDTNNPPASVNAIQEAVYVFPNASAGSDGALVSGDKVKLGNIPAGKSIGFILIQDAWEKDQGPQGKDHKDWGVNTDHQMFFSHQALNPETNTSLKKHSVMVYDAQNKLFLMGFEDLNRQSASSNGGMQSDNDFNDLVIYITSTPVDGISTDGVPNIDRANDSDDDGVKDQFDEYPNDPARAYKNYYPSRDGFATLAFEDNWPKTGDYDLNDMVMKYRYTYVTDAQNQVVEFFADYDVAASGAANKNGFGVEFPFSSALVSQVTGQNITGSYIQLAANGLEAGQSKAVIIPFDNQDNIIKNTDGFQYVNTVQDKAKVTGNLINIKIAFTSPISQATLGEAPFNPFLISDGRRGYEIHLPGYKPTNKADRLLFGTEADNSSETNNRYYLTSDNWPWALSFTEQFSYPVEFKNINSAYLHFLDWARSNGNSYDDWYKNTGTDYRNTANIYNK